MTASSEQPGAEAYLGRVSYQHSRQLRADKKTWQIYKAEKDQAAAHNACGQDNKKIIQIFSKWIKKFKTPVFILKHHYFINSHEPLQS